MESSLVEVTVANDYIAYFKWPIVMDAVAQLIVENRLWGYGIYSGIL